MIIERIMARSSSVVGLNGEGSAFSGEDFTSSSLMPSLSISPVTSGNCTSTPIEPTIEDCRATMWSVALAIM